MTTPELPLPHRPGAVPLWLARHHRRLLPGDETELAPPPILLTAKLHAATPRPSWEALVEGAGFTPVGPDRLRRLVTLPDLVGPDMTVLVIGLNPSPSSAETGIGFARPGNRFWPAALAAGLADRDREPLHALEHHGLGFTDLVKRTTARAAELETDEYRSGVGRVEALVRWLAPQACVMVGLAGWRAAVDRRATAGWQAISLGGRPTYLMPSTSGLNASSSLADLTSHLRAVRGGPAG